MSALENDLEKVFWLGGSPCSGKSLISEILSRQSAGQLHSHFLLSRKIQGVFRRGIEMNYGPGKQ